MRMSGGHSKVSSTSPKRDILSVAITAFIFIGVILRIIVLYFTLNTVFLPQIREFNIYLPFEYHNFFAFMAKGDNFALVQSGFNV